MNKTTSGWRDGLIGVLLFSGSLPATRLAVMDLEPLFLTVARASIAGLLALLMLLRARQPWPTWQQWRTLSRVAVCVVLGFPLLTALALRELSAAHSIVFLAMLPLSTALFAVWRGGERQRAAFWVFALLGCACVMGFALLQGMDATLRGDALMLLAVVVCGFGYAEGAKLSKLIGGWQVISWALVLALPLMLVLCLWQRPADWQAVSTSSWLGLAYVSVFSMLIGFVFWYRGLAQGGAAAVGQLQLLQPLLGLGLAALLLQEQVSAGMLAATVAVLLCVLGARRCAR